MAVFGKERLLSFSCEVHNVKNRLEFLSGESFTNYLHKQCKYWILKGSFVQLML